MEGMNNTVQKETQENKEGTETKEQETKTETKVDVEKVKSDALAGFLKELGVEDKDSLKGIVTKAKEEEDKNKTELQKTSDTLIQTTKELAQERELRVMAEAKILAMQLGVKAELVDDFVIVAKAKVTKEKDISTVITEMKDSSSGSFYFEKDEEREEENKNKVVTRARVKKQINEEEKETKTGKEEVKEKHAGSMAERLFERRKKVNNNTYYSN